MITKTCKKCGKEFHIHDKRYNARKYCSECKKPNVTVRLCSYCNNPFSTHDSRRKYCSDTCSLNARRENNLEDVRLYYQRYPWKKVKRALGSSQLKEHMNSDVMEELRQIKAELKRIGLK